MLVEYPWVVNSVINASHVRASERAELSHSQRAMLKRIECAADNASRGEDADLTRIDLILPYGPGLSTVVWMGCGEFLGEMYAKAVENAEIVLMCVTEKYEYSVIAAKWTMKTARRKRTRKLASLKG